MACRRTEVTQLGYLRPQNCMLLVPCTSTDSFGSILPEFGRTQYSWYKDRYKGSSQRIAVTHLRRRGLHLECNGLVIVVRNVKHFLDKLRQRSWK